MFCLTRCRISMCQGLGPKNTMKFRKSTVRFHPFFESDTLYCSSNVLCTAFGCFAILRIEGCLNGNYPLTVFSEYPSPQLIFIHIHQLFRILYTLFQLDTVNIYWWWCIHFCRVPRPGDRALVRARRGLHTILY